jgi:cell division protein FtsI (penicillin-binding protein 3)
MAVVVMDPDPSRRGYYGGSVSGPVFHDVMQGALRLMDVPPDDIGSWLAAQEKQKRKAGTGNGEQGTVGSMAVAAAAAAVAATPAVAQ